MKTPVFYDSNISLTQPAVEEPAGTDEGKSVQQTASPVMTVLDDDEIHEIPVVIPKPANAQDDEPIDDDNNDEPASTDEPVVEPKKIKKPVSKKTNKTKELEVVEDDGNEPLPKPDGSSSSSASVFAKALAEEGVFTDFDEEEFNTTVKEKGAAAALIELTQKTIDEGIEAYKESLTPMQKQYLDALEKGIPAQDFIATKRKQSQLASIKEEDITKNEKLAKALIVDDLRARDYTDEEIQEELKTIEDLDQISTRAIKAHKFLSRRESEMEAKLAQKAEQERQEEIRRAEQELVTLKDKINAVNEIIPGTPVATKDKTALFDLLTKPVSQSKDGSVYNAIWSKRNENPMQFDIVLAYLFKQGVFNNDWKGLVKKTKTKAISELETVLSQRGSDTRDLGMQNQGLRNVSATAKEILKGMEGFAKSEY